MNSPYRVNEPSGVIVEATGEAINAGDEGWNDYLAWLALQPVPPALLPYVAAVQPLAAQRVEAVARVAAMANEHLTTGTVEAIGHTWNITPPFLLALLVHHLVMPPVPDGFSLPDATLAQVTLSAADLDALCHAISDRAVLINAHMAQLINDAQVSGESLSLPLGEGWPP